MTKFRSEEELECTLLSSLALTALGCPSVRPVSWSLTVHCPALGWVTQALAIWPRYSPELLASSKREVYEQAYLDGA